LQKQDQEILLGSHKDKILLVWNKCDLTAKSLPEKALAISALQKKGLQSLHAAIESAIWKEGLPDKQELILTQERHYNALGQAVSAIERMETGLQGDISPEFLSADMREALQFLSTIIGSDVTEEILNAIFAKFCVGK
jgi:tRNA modification GTPase